MKNIKYVLLTLFLLLFIYNLDIVIISTKEASILFFNKLFISIFPFIILSDVLIFYDYHLFLKNTFGKILSKLFNIDQNSTIVFILSILTSQPCNSIYIKDMLDNELIDINTANKLLCYTYLPSISFVIGTIGITIFNSLKIGIIIYLIVLFNNILIGIYLRKDKTINTLNLAIKKDNNIFETLKKSTLKSINTLSIILSNLIIFNIIINLINKYFTLNPFIKSIISSLLEISNGINNISNINDFKTKIIITIFSLSFSSLSVLFQSFSILSNYNINKKRIIIIKLLFSIITMLLVRTYISRYYWALCTI